MQRKMGGIFSFKFACFQPRHSLWIIETRCVKLEASQVILQSARASKVQDRLKRLQCVQGAAWMF